MKCPSFAVRSLSVGENMIAAISKFNNKIYSWDTESILTYDKYSYKTGFAKKVESGIVIICVLDDIGDIHCFDKVQKFTFKIEDEKMKDISIIEPILCGIDILNKLKCWYLNPDMNHD